MSGGSGAVVVYESSTVYDDFNDRTEATDFGDSSNGNTYSYPGSIPSGVDLSVAGGVGIVTMDDAFGVIIRLPANVIWTQSSGFVMTYDFLTGAIPSGSDLVQIQFPVGVSAEITLYLGIASNAFQGEVSVFSDVGSDIIVKTDWLADTWYTAKLEHRPGDVLRARVWPRSTTEPTTWDVSLAGGGVTLSGWLDLIPDNNSGGTYTLEFDNIGFGGGTPVVISGR
jgi:hypothetical protein